MRALVGATVACTAVAAILFAIAGSVVVTGIGIVLGGTAFVLLVSTAFYLVGRSEDRARERDRAGGAR